MSYRTIEVGDICLSRSFKRLCVGPRVQATFGFKTKKGEALVFLYLGVANADDPSDFNPESVLEEMGWQYVGDGNDSTTSPVYSVVAPPTEQP